MMITKNSPDLEILTQLIHLLDDGVSLQDSLDILETLHQNNVLYLMKKSLGEGVDIISIFRKYLSHPTLIEIFESLYPIKGLSSALNDAISFYDEKQKWVKNISKQLSYPLFLILFMMVFTFFVIQYLFPQMQLLLSSFNLSPNHGFLLWIEWIPQLLFKSVLVILFIFCYVYYCLYYSKMKMIHLMLRIPVLNNCIRLYYTIQFSFYFSKIVGYFDNLYDAMNYFYQTHQSSKLKYILKEILNGLKEGYTLETVIFNSIYFTPSFKKYIAYIFKSHQNFSVLEKYSQIILSQVHRYILYISKLLMLLIYTMTGIYIILLYSIMILPVLEITSSL